MKILLFPLAILLGIACAIWFYKPEPTDIVREAIIYEWHYYDHVLSKQEIGKLMLSDTGIVYAEKVDSAWIDLSDSLVN